MLSASRRLVACGEIVLSKTRGRLQLLPPAAREVGVPIRLVITYTRLYIAQPYIAVIDTLLLICDGALQCSSKKATL